MRRRYAVLAAVALAGLLATWLVAPNLLVGLRSPRALAWTAAVGAGCLAVGLLARVLRAPGWLAVTAAVLPGAVAVGLVVVRPILAPRSLTEDLPSALPSATRSATPSASPPTAVPTGPTATPAGPERLATGTLRGLAGHSAAGRVATYRLADGSYVVRFEDVDIGGTPDPEVYVLPGRDRTGKRGGTHLGALKAERGSFHYALPAAFRDGDFTVLVWCEQFAVDIAHATQNRN